VFEPGDVNQLALQLKRLITDVELRRKIEKASEIFAETTFNKDKINRQLGEIYDQLLQ
jgi:glycosyltransferase involved in cell wall biosynthesis